MKYMETLPLLLHSAPNRVAQGWLGSEMTIYGEARTESSFQCVLRITLLNHCIGLKQKSKTYWVCRWYNKGGRVTQYDCRSGCFVGTTELCPRFKGHLQIHLARLFAHLSCSHERKKWQYIGCGQYFSGKILLFYSRISHVRHGWNSPTSTIHQCNYRSETFVNKICSQVNVFHAITQQCFKYYVHSEVTRGMMGSLKKKKN